MPRVAWILTVVFVGFILAVFPARAAERQIAHYQALTASIDAAAGCDRQASITVHAPDESPYAGDRLALQRLLATVRAGLSAECPTLSEIDVAGLAAGRPVFRAKIIAANGWTLPTDAGSHPSFTTITAGNTGILPGTVKNSPFPTIVTATSSETLPADGGKHTATVSPLSPLAVRTSTCDYNPNDPLVGCWVTISPPQWRRAILNIRDDEKNSWFNDWPEKLADGSTSKIGIRIQRIPIPGFGPSLELVDSEGWRANRKGPFFAEGCSIMRIDPAAEPINTILGMFTGEAPEPAYFVRLRAPLRITADLLKDGYSGPGGFTGHAGDAEIVEGIPDDARVPAFNRCVDNFDEDGELLLDVLLVAIPATRLPALVSGRFSSRLAAIARRNPAKYERVLRSLESSALVTRPRWMQLQAQHAWEGRTDSWTKRSINSASDLEAYIARIRNAPDMKKVLDQRTGRTAYGKYTDNKGGVVVIDNPMDTINGGTAFPTRNIDKRFEDLK